MKTTKITNGDISDKTVSSLPTRPTAPRAFGGIGYTANDMKEAFDRLPLYIIEKFNSLIDDITAEPGNSISDEIKTGFGGGTLTTFFEDILNGNILKYIGWGEGTLEDFLTKLREDADAIINQTEKALQGDI